MSEEPRSPLGVFSDPSPALGGVPQGEGVAGREKESVPVERENQPQPEQHSNTATEQLASVLRQTSPKSNAAQPTHAATDDARNLSLLEDVESQVQRLLDVAMYKGVPHAVDVARQMKSYYLLDRTHDDLVDKFYQKLVEKGLVEKE